MVWRQPTLKQTEDEIDSKLARMVVSNAMRYGRRP